MSMTVEQALAVLAECRDDIGSDYRSSPLARKQAAGARWQAQYDEALATLRAELAGLRADASVSRRGHMWLAGTDSGLSSKAICRHMLGIKSRGDCPHDPSDLGRCLRMLELFPEWKPRIGEMATYSPQWAALAANWDSLAEMMADEVGINWTKGLSAPKTYAAMRAAIDAARQQESSHEG